MHSNSRSHKHTDCVKILCKFVHCSNTGNSIGKSLSIKDCFNYGTLHNGIIYSHEKGEVYLYMLAVKAQVAEKECEIDLSDKSHCRPSVSKCIEKNWKVHIKFDCGFIFSLNTYMSELLFHFLSPLKGCFLSGGLWTEDLTPSPPWDNKLNQPPRSDAFSEVGGQGGIGFGDGMEYWNMR